MTAVDAGDVPPGHVLIRYLRPPGKEERFVQRLILDRGDAQVTLTESLARDRAMVVDGRVVLEHGSPIVWFTFPGAWHDIGRFHRRDGRFTGLYANIIRPIEAGPGPVWSMTDLCLDVWMGNGGGARILDEDELAQSVRLGHVAAGDAQRAREEAQRIVEEAARGSWPPALVREWTLERIRAAG